MEKEHESTTEEAIDSRVDLIAGKIVASGRVKNEKNLVQKLRKIMKDFHFLGESLSQMSFSGWEPSKLRLEMGIKATGKIIFGKVGGDIRLRLDWKRTGSKGIKKRASRNVW